MKVDLIQYDQCVYEKGKFGHRHTWREDNVKRQLTHSQDKECQRLPVNNRC